MRAALAAVLLFAAGAAAAVEPPLPRPPTPGAVCGRADLVGVPLPPVTGAGGCGIAAPVRLEAGAGVALEPAPVVGCPLARALADWLEASAKPAFRSSGGLAGLGIAAAYVCRNVSGAGTGELSEHARGRALDIARFELADGRSLSVRQDWGQPPWGGVLRRIHREACGPFGTAIGPDSDARHADHLHLDVAARRRPYCP